MIDARYDLRECIQPLLRVLKQITFEIAYTYLIDRCLLNGGVDFGVHCHEELGL